MLRRGERQQPGADGLLGAPQQIAQEFDRQVDAQPEDLDQFVVAIGAGDDAGIAGFREARAGVVGELADDLAARRGRR